MAALTYRLALDELEARGMMPETAPSLEPMHAALKKLALPPRDPKQVVVVAGTNGKGSVCAALEALCLSAGESVGLYTSPHLVETTERFRIGGRDISEDEFVEAYREVVKRTHEIPLTHFEMLTLMAVWIFDVQSRVDRVILEVGLGGLWDATNAVPHGVCIITALGMDHQNLLGNTLTQIAENKFGIVSPHSTVIHTPFADELSGLADQTRRATQSRWVAAPKAPTRIEKLTQTPPRYFAQTPWGEAEINLPGARGTENAVTALTAFEHLGHEPARHLAALKQIRWPGRMEKIDAVAGLQSHCALYFSGDHNPQGVQSLIELLPDYSRSHLHLLVGVGKDKDLDGVLGPLFALQDTSVYLTETPYRGLPLGEYGTWLGRSQGYWSNSDHAFKEVLLRAKAYDMILVTGSLYLIGHLKRELLRSADMPTF